MRTFIKGSMQSVFIFIIAAVLAAISFSGQASAEEIAAPGRALYVFAHQDDEICIAAKMKSDVIAGKEITVVWITNGDKAGDPVAREQESREAMEFIGAPQERLHFLGYGDSYAVQNMIPAYARILEIASETQPDEIVSNAYEGGHIDHDTAHFVANMVSRGMKNNPPHYEFPLYNAYKGTYQVGKFIPRDNVETLATQVNDEIAKAKVGIINFYPSQKAILLPLTKLVSKKRLKKKGEPYRLVPDYDYAEPPTEGTLGYELPGSRIEHSFSEFKEAVMEFYASPQSPMRE